MKSKSRPSSSGSALLRVLAFTLVIAGALLGLFPVYALSVYEEPPVDPGWAIAGSEQAATEPGLRFVTLPRFDEVVLFE